MEVAGGNDFFGGRTWKRSCECTWSREHSIVTQYQDPARLVVPSRNRRAAKALLFHWRADLFSVAK